jgi:hypothetical protein
MKKKNLKVISVCVLFAFFTMTIISCNQAKTAKDDAKEQAKLEKAKVPAEVTNSYSQDYPTANNDENWYGHPAYGYKDNWYDNWFEYGTYSRPENPEYYEVDFNKDNIPYKAIYSKSGKKIAIHKSLNSDIPKAVSDSISKGEYKDWTMGKDKEEIFKDKDQDQMKVYKVDVEKGNDKHTLFYQTDGTLLYDKKNS